MKLMAQVSQKKDLEKISRVLLPDTDIFYKCLCDTSTSTSHLFWWCLNGQYSLLL